MSCSRNAWCVSLNGWNEASSITAITWSSKSDGQHEDVVRRGLAEAGRDADVVLRRLGDQDRLLLERRLADEPLADLEAVRDRLRCL